MLGFYFLPSSKNGFGLSFRLYFSQDLEVLVWNSLLILQLACPRPKFIELLKHEILLSMKKISLINQAHKPHCDVNCFRLVFFHSLLSMKQNRSFGWQGDSLKHDKRHCEIRPCCQRNRSLSQNRLQVIFLELSTSWIFIHQYWTKLKQNPVVFQLNNNKTDIMSDPKGESDW